MHSTNTQNMIFLFAPNLQGRCKNCPNDRGAEAVAAAIFQQVRTAHCQSKSDLFFFGQTLQGTKVRSCQHTAAKQMNCIKTPSNTGQFGYSITVCGLCVFFVYFGPRNIACWQAYVCVWQRATCRDRDPKMDAHLV